MTRWWYSLWLSSEARSDTSIAFETLTVETPNS